MAEWTTVTQVPEAPPRPVGAHKGTFGTVIVVGGGLTMIGAPAICASAALRWGAGLVKAAVPAEVLAFVLTIEPGATGIALHTSSHPGQEAFAEADPEERAVLAVGPGMGKSDWAGALVNVALRGRRAVVLDADGLNLLAASGRPRPHPGPALVMTPHPGEFARLAKAVGVRASPTDPRSRPEAAAKLAAAHRAVVVLKGERTIVSDGQRVYTNTTGNPALATAGSGDVLTGVIAALIGQHLTPFDAAVLGVFLHGLAGDLWTKRNGPSGLTARELAQLLPEAFERRRGQAG